MDSSSGLSKNLPVDFLARHVKLSREQAGHLRHFHNLATQRDGEWGVMGSQEPGQEWLDAYRYQIATMSYAAGVAHFHRLPALRSIFQSLLDGLIHRMLRREVWGYWFLTSHSGKFVDPDIKELRQPWADPIVRENIMVRYLSLFCWIFLPLFWVVGVLFLSNLISRPLLLRFLPVCFSAELPTVLWTPSPHGIAVYNAFQR